jgi:hypothetical protein
MAGRGAHAREKRRTPGPVFNLFKKIFKTMCIDSVYFKTGSVAAQEAARKKMGLK